MQTQVKISWRQLFKNPLLVVNKRLASARFTTKSVRRTATARGRRSSATATSTSATRPTTPPPPSVPSVFHYYGEISFRLFPGLNFPWKYVQFFFIRDTKCPNCFYFHTFVMFSISAGWWDLCCCKGGGVVGWWDDGSQLRLKLTIFKIFARKIYCWSLWWRRRIQG